MAVEPNRREPEEEGWDALAQAWQQILPPRLEQAPAELRRRVRRTDLRFRLYAALEYLAYAGLIALMVVYLRQHKGMASFLWGFMMMGFVAWGLDFAVRIRRGVWQAADSSTAAWLDLLAERCARKRRYARVSWLMFGAMSLGMAVLLLAFAIWLPKDFARIAGSGWQIVGVMVGLLGFQWLWSKWYLQQVAAEEAWIAALRDEAEPAAPPALPPP